MRRPHPLDQQTSRSCEACGRTLPRKQRIHRRDRFGMFTCDRCRDRHDVEDTDPRTSQQLIADSRTLLSSLRS